MALKEAPERLWDEQYKMKLSQVLLSQFQSQVVSITQSAIRSCGYLLEYIISNGEAIPNNVLVAFVRVKTFETSWAFVILVSFRQ